MKPKRSIFLAIFMALSLTALSQFYTGGLSSSLNIPRTQYVIDSTGKLRFKSGDVGFSMQVGTGFAGNFKGNSSIYTYASPSVAYNVSSRFRIRAGISLVNNFGDPLYTGYDPYYSPVMNTGTTTGVFVQGDYLLSKKLMLSGAYYRDFTSFNTHSTDPRYKTPDIQGMILNLNYRPTDNFEINASFGYGNGYRSSLHSPFYDNSVFPGYSLW